jgi:hypothetical protein
MNFLAKFIYGKHKIPKKRKRRLLVFIAACTMFLGVAFQGAFKFNSEYFLLAGFGFYTLAELFE